MYGNKASAKELWKWIRSQVKIEVEVEVEVEVEGKIKKSRHNSL